MHTTVKKVEILSTPTYSRQPHDDEAFVIKEFTKHAKHCSQCAHPYDSFRDRKSLCERGIAFAKDVAQYLYGNEGRAYSKVESQGNKSTHIEIPPDCEVVRQLLKAIEKGMRLHARSKPVISYDANYYVAARPIRLDPSHLGNLTIESNHRRQKERKDENGAQAPLYRSGRAKSKDRGQDSASGGRSRRHPNPKHSNHSTKDLVSTMAGVAIWVWLAG